MKLDRAILYAVLFGGAALVLLMVFSSRTIVIDSKPEARTETLFIAAPLAPPPELPLGKTVGARVITAYSSTPDQTDNTPFVTASNTRVRDGIAAANWLPFGAKIKLPDIYGDKVFIVEDRMHPKNDEKVDIWMSSRDDAIQFGIKRSVVYILE